MKASTHRIYIWIMAVIGIAAVMYIGFYGWDYYTTPVTERNLHDRHQLLSPVGLIGHGFGFLGTLMMLIGVAIYSLRKRWGVLQSVGQIKHVLEFHIFLCLLGPALIVYHTAFKFGGLIGLSFWCMALVVASGVVGRYLYLQIPKTVTGREISPLELKKQVAEIRKTLLTKHAVEESLLNQLDSLSIAMVSSNQSVVLTFPKLLVHNLTLDRKIAGLLHANGAVDSATSRLISERAHLHRQLDNLTMTQSLFRYWHLFHLPLALIMLLIAIAHIVTAFLFGYGWVFTNQ